MQSISVRKRWRIRQEISQELTDDNKILYSLLQKCKIYNIFTGDVKVIIINNIVNLNKSQMQFLYS